MSLIPYGVTKIIVKVWYGGGGSDSSTEDAIKSIYSNCAFM